MNKLNEEEILDKLRKMLYHTQRANECGLSNNDFKEDIEALEGILDLYNKEKEKNKELEEKRKTTMEVIGANYIHKDKIKDTVEYIRFMVDDDNKSSEIVKEVNLYLDLFLQELLEEGDE